MSTPTDTIVDSVVDGAQRTQDAMSATVTGAMRTWADAVQTFTSGRAAMPDAQVVVDRWFEIAQTVLDTQKVFARSFAGAGAHTVGVVAEQADRTARTVADQTAYAAENVATEVALATEVAAEEIKYETHDEG